LSGVIGQRAAAAVDADLNSRPRCIRTGRVEPEQSDVAAVAEQHGADGAALAVDAGVLVV
jgi:hypothetical protein